MYKWFSLPMKPGSRDTAKATFVKVPIVITVNCPVIDIDCY